MSPRLGVRETSLLACLRTRAAVCQTAPERFFKMSGPKKFFKYCAYCVLVLLLMVTLASPVLLMTLCAIDLADRDVKPLPRVFHYILIFYAYGGLLMAYFLKRFANMSVTIVAIFAGPYFACVFCFFYDFGKAIYVGLKFHELGSTLSPMTPLTSSSISNFWATQCGDAPLGLFLAVLTQLSLVISHFVAIVFVLGREKSLWMWIREQRPHCASSRLTQPVSTYTRPPHPVSTNTRPPQPVSANTRPILNDQPQQPKYESIVLMDLPPPSYESLLPEQLQI